MGNNSKNETIAGIDLGSYALRMKIAEVDASARQHILELLKYPISLGSETYTLGSVNFDTVDEICDILKGFKKLMQEYRVKTYRAVATSAVREAGNREYIVDQIKLKTGLQIEVINNAQERFLTYKAIRDHLPNISKWRNEGMMLATVGAGSVEISFYIHNKLVFSQNIKVGPLRLREVLAGVEGRTLNFPKLLEEEIDSNIDRIYALIDQENCKHFLAIGGEIRTISKLCNQKTSFEELKYIDKTDFLQVYKKLVNMLPEDIEKEYRITPDRAYILAPSMMIFHRFLEMTKAKGIHAPLISLRDGLVADIIDHKYNTQRKSDFASDVISFTRHLANRYLYDQKHAEAVEQNALSIFDRLLKLHGLGERERVMLQIAAILHDTGKFINLNNHYIHSYNIIMGTELFGISQDFLEIIANVARYHSIEVPSLAHDNFRSLSETNRVIVSKLAAIISLADAIDISHKQKISNLMVTLDEKKVVIAVESKENLLLEESTFETKAKFFREVFGVLPQIKIKRLGI